MNQVLSFIKRVVAVALVVLGLTFILQSPSYAAGIPQGDWTLTSLNGKPPSEGTTITIKFDDEGSGTASGSGGCNRYFGPYTSTGSPSSGQIKFGLIASTKKLCYPTDVMEQEAKYFEALESVETYEISEPNLVLASPKTTLEYTK